MSQCIPHEYITPKLSEYIHYVEIQTGRVAEIKIINGSQVSPWTAMFIHNPEKMDIIEIVINLDYYKHSKTVIETVLAHELTHALLHYVGNYPTLNPSCESDTLQFKIANILCSMLQTYFEDIVINTLIHRKGFPFRDDYLQLVRTETKLAKHKCPLSNNISGRIEIDRWMTVSAYTHAWGYLNYTILEEYQQKILQKFLNAYPNAYPEEYAMACFVTNQLQNNDIFTAKGFEQFLFIIITEYKLPIFIKYCKN